MEMTKKQAEFWAFIIIICSMTALAILIVDFGIKSAILEESTRLRLTIEEHSGHKRQKSDDSRTANDPSDDSHISGDVLVVNSQRMEKGNVHNGAEKASNGSPDRESKPSRSVGRRTIPHGNE
jgi:hypothetical protein